MKLTEKTDAKQTQKNKFAPGNKIGNRFPKGTSGNKEMADFGRFWQK